MTYAMPMPRKNTFSARVSEMVSPPDAELVARLLRRDESALGALYDRHSGAMYGLALKLLSDADAAQEVVQDAFLNLWERPGRFDAGRAELRAYFLVVVRSRSLDRLRREKGHLPLFSEEGDEFPMPDERVDLQGAAEQVALSGQVRAALVGLSAAHRETVERAYFGDQSREEIAEVMGVPVGTVKSRLKYALDKLRGVLVSRDAVGWDE